MNQQQIYRTVRREVMSLPSEVLCYCGKVCRGVRGLRIHQTKSPHYCRRCLAGLTVADETAGKCTQCGQPVSSPAVN